MPTSTEGTPGDSPLPMVGRRERVDFPEWGLPRVRAKVDTGAYSSALDVHGAEMLDGGRRVRFEVALRRSPARAVTVEAPVVGVVSVRCSSGRVERRPVVEPLIRLGDHSCRVRLTLTDRASLRCRMLLGRQALAGRFLVDVRFKDLLSKAAPPPSLGPASAGPSS